MFTDSDDESNEMHSLHITTKRHCSIERIDKTKHKQNGQAKKTSHFISEYSADKSSSEPNRDDRGRSTIRR